MTKPLTQRQLQILKLIAAGHTQVRIAKDLRICVGTVEGHVQNLYRHAKVNCVARLMLWAVKNGILTP